MSTLKVLLAASAITAVGATAATAATLDDVKQKGFVQCGVSTGVPGFSYTDDAGNWQGFDPSVCQAVAAAVFGDSTKVRSEEHTSELQSLMRISYAVFCLKKKNHTRLTQNHTNEFKNKNLHASTTVHHD